MSALKKCMSILKKARVDEGHSPAVKQKMRESRNDRQKLSNFIPTQKQGASKEFMRHGKTVGTPKMNPRGVHRDHQGQSAAGSAAKYATQWAGKKPDLARHFKDQAKERHAKVQNEMKTIRPKLAKAMDFLEKARVDEGKSHQEKVNSRASRHERVSSLSGKIVGATKRVQMEQGVHKPTGGKNMGFNETSRLGDMIKRKDGGAKLEIKGTHKRLKNIKPKLVKALNWLEESDLKKGENDELAFHADRARAAQYANKTAIAKDHFNAFLKIAIEQCKVASSIYGMRSLLNKTLDYYLDLADTKVYASNNVDTVSSGSSESALVVFFKNGGKFEPFKS